MSNETPWDEAPRITKVLDKDPIIGPVSERIAAIAQELLANAPLVSLSLNPKHPTMFRVKEKDFVVPANKLSNIPLGKYPIAIEPPDKSSSELFERYRALRDFLISPNSGVKPYLFMSFDTLKQTEATSCIYAAYTNQLKKPKLEGDNYSLITFRTQYQTIDTSAHKVSPPKPLGLFVLVPEAKCSQLLNEFRAINSATNLSFSKLYWNLLRNLIGENNILDLGKYPSPTEYRELAGDTKASERKLILVKPKIFAAFF